MQLPSMRGVISAGSAVATEAGSRVLRQGGNAVDAAVATAFALAVADPANTSLAGRCHVLIAWPDGRAVALDGRTALPAAGEDGSDQSRPAGARVVPVPGNPRTLVAAVEQFGRLAPAQVIAPAVRLAAEGYAVPPRLSAAWHAAAHLLRRDAATQRYFLHHGKPWAVGEHRVQPALAAVLDDLGRDGPDTVMDGRRSERLITHLRSMGSTLTRDDFAAYQPLEGEVVRSSYRGWQVCTIGRQGHGHALAATLSILECFDIARMDASERWVTLALAQAIAHRGRKTDEHAAADHLLDPCWHTAGAERLRALRADPALVGGWLHRRRAAPQARRADTTHISAIDETGLAVALTSSIGPHFGALVAAPDDGFLFAHSYRMAERNRSLRRDRTEMVPTILRHPDGRCIALGAAGSTRIPGAVIRGIVNMIDLELSAEAATAAPGANWYDGTLVVNPAMGEALFDQLTAAGLPAAWMQPRYGVHYGLLHAVTRDVDGTLDGGADPFWDGAVWHCDGSNCATRLV